MRIALILLAGLIVGYVAGYLQYADAADQAVQADRTERTRLEAAPKPEPDGEPPLDPQAIEILGTSAPPLALNDLAVPALPTGTATIRGVVLDEHKKPVPDVRVQLRHQREFKDAMSSGRRSEQDIEDLARAFVVRELYSRGAVSEAWTDDEGVFVFNDLAEEGYRISASREGYEIKMTEPTTRYWDPVKAPSEVTFRARAQLGLYLRLEYADGTVPETFRLETQHSGPTGTMSSSEQWSASKPTLKLVAGSWTLKPGSNEDFTFEPFTVNVTEGEPLESKTIVLRARRGIAGKVLEGEDQPDQHGVVEIHYLRDDDRKRSVKDLGFQTPSVHAHSHDGWRFRIVDIEPGTYLLSAKSWTIDKHGPAQWVTVNQEGVVEVALERASFEEGDLVTVTVRSPDDEPVTDASFTMTWRQGSGSSSHGRQALHGGEPGVYRVALPNELKGLKGAEATLSVNSGTYGQEEVAFDHLNPGDLLVQYERQARLTVRIGGVLSAEVSKDLNIGVQKLTQEEMPTSSTTRPLADNPTEVHFDNLSPGQYRIYLGHSPSHHSGFSSHWSQELATVQLEAGAQRAVGVSLPGIGSLTVIVPKDDAGMHMSLTGGEGGGKRSLHSFQRADDSGRVTFGTLPDGEYMITSGDRGSGMPVRVAGPTEVRYTPRAARGLLVSIHQADGPLAKAGFRDGDIIVNVDGKELKDLGENMGMAMMSLMGSRECPLIVERGGRRVELTINGRQLQRSGRRGSGIGGDVNPIF